MEQKNNKYYSYISEYYAANPTKFEKRKNNLKPVLYLGLAVVGAVLAIFPGLLPLAGWLVRTAGIIMTLVCLIAAYLNNFDIYNFQSGGKVKSMGVKKFKRDETNPGKLSYPGTLNIWQTFPEEEVNRYNFILKKTPQDVKCTVC